MRIGLATIVRGRAVHAARQGRAVAALPSPPDRYVAVCMDPVPGPPPGAEAIHLPVADGAPLPLARARNLAIEALAADCDLAVLLDADCLPAPGLLARYAAAAGDTRLLAGPVGRLGPLADDVPAPSPAALAAARADAGGRPVPPSGTVVVEPRVELFWSLSFAVTPAAHARLGGFDERYAGYGGEDTDYAFRARARDVELCWVGGAWAYHQHHPVSSPPREHLADIVRNARRFRSVWGSWPMAGWLAAFAADGLVEWTPDGDRLRLA